MAYAASLNASRGFRGASCFAIMIGSAILLTGPIPPAEVTGQQIAPRKFNGTNVGDLLNELFDKDHKQSGPPRFDGVSEPTQTFLS